MDKQIEQIYYFQRRISNVERDALKSQKVADVELIDTKYDRITNAVQQSRDLDKENKTKLCEIVYENRQRLPKMPLPKEYNTYKLPEAKFTAQIKDLADSMATEKGYLAAEYYSDLNKKIRECNTYGVPDIVKLRRLYRGIGLGTVKLGREKSEDGFSRVVKSKSANPNLLDRVSKSVESIINEIKARINKMQQVLAQLIEKGRITKEQAVTALRKRINEMIQAAAIQLQPTMG